MEGEEFCKGCDGGNDLVPTCPVAIEGFHEVKCILCADEEGYRICGQLRFYCPKHPDRFLFHAKRRDGRE